MPRVDSPVRSVTIEHYQVRLPQTQTYSDLSLDKFEYVLVRVTAGDVVGTGWAYTTGLGGDAIVALLRDAAAPTVIGRPLFDLRGSWSAVHKALRRGGWGLYSASALGAMDIAMWDAVARAQGLPLYAALGGQARKVKTYGSTVAWSKGPDQIAEDVRALVQQGFTAIKVKVGPDRDHDERRLAAVRDVLGPQTPLFVDANQTWSLQEVIERQEQMRRFDVRFLEEPLSVESYEYAGLRNVSSVPIAAGEELNSAAAFTGLVSGRAASLLQPDICRIGGITEWLRVLGIAEAHSLPITTHYTIEIAVHLAMLSNSVRYVEITDHNMVHLGVAEGGIEVGPGSATPTTNPGHGIQFTFSEQHHQRTLEVSG